MSDNVPPTPPARTARSGTVLWVVLTLFAVAALAWFVVPRPTAWQKPVLLGKAEIFPDAIRRESGAWYWIERPVKGPARLVRATPGNLTAVATADTIPGYDVADGRLIWTARQGRRWSVVQADLDGQNPKELWSGGEQPFGAKGLGDTVFWVRRTPAPVPVDLPFPVLQGTLEVVSLKAGQTNPTVFARLPESGDATVLGWWGDTLLLAAFRRDTPGSTLLYRVPRAGGVAERFHSAALQVPPVLTRAGELYEVVASKEATSPLDMAQLLRFRADGRPEPVSDWLPGSGSLYETHRGVLFGDREFPPTLWTVRGADTLPEAVAVPPNYYGVAAGERHLLLTQTTFGGPPSLYEVSLP